MTNQARRRITVVLHDKPQSRQLLEIGASIASLLKAELEGVFVEDAALFRLTGLPFLRELKRDSRTEERLDATRLAQEWRAMARLAREALENSAQRAGLPWSFRVWRGELDRELLDLALESEMLLLGRLSGTIPWRLRQKAAAESDESQGHPLKIGVILDGGGDAERLQTTITELGKEPGIQLILFLLPGEAAQGEQPTPLQAADPRHHNIILHLNDREPATLALQLKAAACDLLMISENSALLQGEDMSRRLKALPFPLVVVR